MTPPEIHQKKRKIVEHVDARDLVVELDRVEQRGAAVEHDDVAEVKVAVTLTHEPGIAPRIEMRAVMAESVTRPPREHLAGGPVQDAGTLLAKRGGVAVDDP